MFVRNPSPSNTLSTGTSIAVGEAPSKNINGSGSFTTVLSVLPVLSQRASFQFDASEPNVFNHATHLDLVAFIPGNNCAIGATRQVAVDRTKIDAGRFTNHVLRYTRQSHSAREQPPDILLPRFILPVGRPGRDSRGTHFAEPLAPPTYSALWSRMAAEMHARS